MDIGAFLHNQRETKQLTQRELAARAGVAAGMVSQYETGRRIPTFETVDKLLAGIGLQLCCTAEPLWADVDREIAALRDADLGERIERREVARPGRAAGIMNLQRWSENWNDWGYSDRDPREPGPLRWRSPYGELRVRLFDEPAHSIDLVLQGDVWPVRPLSDVESDDPWVTRVLARMRARLPSAA